MNDLLLTLESLTAETRRECAAGGNRAGALIGARNTAIEQLCELIRRGTLISRSELDRIQCIERDGAEILEGARKMRETIQDNLDLAGRQQSFAKSIEGVLEVPNLVEVSA